MSICRNTEAPHDIQDRKNYSAYEPESECIEEEWFSEGSDIMKTRKDQRGKNDRECDRSRSLQAHDFSEYQSKQRDQDDPEEKFLINPRSEGEYQLMLPGQYHGKLKYDTCDLSDDYPEDQRIY